MNPKVPLPNGRLCAAFGTNHAVNTGVGDSRALRQRGDNSLVIPGRAERRGSGIHTLDDGYGFSGLAGARRPGMTMELGDAHQHSRGAICVRALRNPCPSENGGRRECRVHAAPTATRANEKDARRPTQVRRNHSGTPCAMALRLLRALPGVSGVLVTVAAQIRIAQLDPSVEGTGPHGLTVRIAPHVLRPNASIATRLTSGDEWPSRPPCRGGLASLNHNFCLSERRIFLFQELDSSGKTGGGFSPAPGPALSGCYFSCSIVTATFAFADSLTLLPSTPATRPLSMKW